MMPNQKATAVLLRYKRNNELKEIVSYLKTFSDLINEIIIWDNRKHNVCGYGRYLGALEARNSIIYTQDDDCIVKNIRELFEKYDGTCIINNMKKGHLNRYKNLNHTLPGWGMIFDKSWIYVLNNYIQLFGMDELFFRDTGRIFTGLFGNYKSIEGDVKNFKSATDPKIALWKQKNHWENRKIIIDRIEKCKKENKKSYNHIILSEKIL